MVLSATNSNIIRFSFVSTSKYTRYLQQNAILFGLIYERRSTRKSMTADMMSSGGNGDTNGNDGAHCNDGTVCALYLLSLRPKPFQTITLQGSHGVCM